MADEGVNHGVPQAADGEKDPHQGGGEVLDAARVGWGGVKVEDPRARSDAHDVEPGRGQAVEQNPAERQFAGSFAHCLSLPGGLAYLNQRLRRFSCPTVVLEPWPG